MYAYGVRAVADVEEEVVVVIVAAAETVVVVEDAEAVAEVETKNSY